MSKPATWGARSLSWPLRRALVSGPSMAPVLRDGDVALVWLARPRSPWLLRRLVGRVVLVELPDRPLSIKRLTGVGADGALWVEGDNPDGSTDSRQLGAQPAGSVRGVMLLRLSRRRPLG